MTIAKLIVDVAANTVQLTKDVQKVHGTLDGIATSASKARVMLARTFTIAAIGTAIKSFAAAAGQLEDLSVQTGVSLSALQRFKFGAEQTGNTLGDVVAGLDQMNKRLGGGERSALDGLRGLGLSFEALRQMKPEDALLAIADAIAKVPDPMRQADLATDLFGKTGIRLLPTLKGNMRELGDEAARLGLVMANDTVRDAAKLDDAFDKLLSIGKSLIASVLGPFVPLLNLVAEALAAVSSKLTQGVTWVVNYAKAAVDLKARFQDWVNLYRSWTDAPDPPKPPRLMTPAGIQDVADATDGMARLNDGLDDQFAASTKASDAVEDHARAIRNLREELSGRGAITAATDMLEALRGTIDVSRMTRDAQDRVNAVMTAAIAVYTAQGKVAPASIRSIAAATMDLGKLAPPVVEGLGRDSQHLGQQIAVVAPAIVPTVKVVDDLTASLTKLSWKVAVEAPKAAKTLSQTLGANLLKTLEQVPQVLANAFTGGGNLGGALKAVASMVGATIGGSIGMAVGGPLGQAVGSALGSLAGPLLGKIAGWLGIGTTEYEKRVRAAAQQTRELQKTALETAGGMEALRLKAHLVGIQIDEAFKWRDPEALKKVLDDVEAKTAKLNAAMQEYGFTWEDLPEKARSAKLAEQFEDLFEKTDILRVAGIDYNEILRRQAGQYSELVQAAIRTGTEIPAGMRPVLDDLMAMGLLVDENGAAFKDLSNVTFAETLTKGLKNVTDAIYAVRDALLEGVGGAMDDLGRRQVRIPVRFDVDDLPEPGGRQGNREGFAHGTPGLGFVDFGRATPTWLHGREAVVPEGGTGDLAAQIAGHLNARGGGMGDGQAMTLVLEDGTPLRGYVVRQAKRAAATGALRPRVTAGRSY